MNHHKNLFSWSSMINSQRKADTLYISWTQRNGELCLDHSGHTFITETGAMVFADHAVINVIDAAVGPTYQISGTLMAIHEFAHILGMGDIYDDASTGHNTNRNYNCVMKKYPNPTNSTDTRARDMYDDIMEDGRSPFCDDCLELLWSLIETWDLS